MNHIDVLPLVSRQSRSVMPSPLKSPVPASVQTKETLPSPPEDITLAPFMRELLQLKSLPPARALPKSRNPSLPKPGREKDCTRRRAATFFFATDAPARSVTIERL